MAEKRMFAKTIVESGAFYDLSIKAQCLYFHLGMLADDYGFLNNALVICKGCGFTKATLQELIDKRFVLDCGDNITVIKHWQINNTIASDRKKETMYKDKLDKLILKENKSYTDNIHNDCKLDADCIQNTNKIQTQYRLDKNSIDKYSDDDINNINRRMLEIGTEEKTINKALKIYANKNYPKTSGFYQRIINTLIDNKIYDKEAYISEIARNYALD